MARRIRLPGIVDVVLVSDPAEIRALNDARGVDRNFVLRGPLINRLIVARIHRWFQIMGQLLPSLTRRYDQVRADHQQKLAAAIDPISGNTLWSSLQIDALAGYVRGSGTDEAAGIVAQQIVGSLFDPVYHADGATWKAAKLIDQFRDGISPIQIVWHLTGQLRPRVLFWLIAPRLTVGRCTAPPSVFTVLYGPWRRCVGCAPSRTRNLSAMRRYCGNASSRQNKCPAPSKSRSRPRL